MCKLMNVDEVAELLGVKKSTINQWTHLEYILHVKLGKLLRFKEEELQRCLGRKSIKAKANCVVTNDHL